MSAKNRLHFFRMCAWDMFDPDALERRERKVRIRQIRHVIEDVGCKLHISGDAERTRYVLMKDGVAIHWSGTVDPTNSGGKLLNTLPRICEALLPLVDAKFPPNPER